MIFRAPLPFAEAAATARALGLLPAGLAGDAAVGRLDAQFTAAALLAAKAEGADWFQRGLDVIDRILDGDLAIPAGRAELQAFLDATDESGLASDARLDAEQDRAADFATSFSDQWPARSFLHDAGSTVDHLDPSLAEMLEEDPGLQLDDDGVLRAAANANHEHWPAGTPEGKGGQFAPKGSVSLDAVVEEAAAKKGTAFLRSRYAEVDAADKARLSPHTSADLTGYGHEMDSHAARHALKAHGDPAREAARGQVAITAADLRRIPEVIRGAHSVERGQRTPAGRETLVYRLHEPGTTLVVEEVRTKRHTLAFHSMRRFKGRVEVGRGITSG